MNDFCINFQIKLKLNIFFFAFIIFNLRILKDYKTTFTDL